MKILEMDNKVKPNYCAQEIIKDYKRLESKIRSYELHEKLAQMSKDFDFKITDGCEQREVACTPFWPGSMGSGSISSMYSNIFNGFKEFRFDDASNSEDSKNDSNNNGPGYKSPSGKGAA
jgi:hypothetical protein